MTILEFPKLILYFSNKKKMPTQLLIYKLIHNTEINKILELNIKIHSIQFMQLILKINIDFFSQIVVLVSRL